MRALLSSENFDGFGGTETYVLTVAEQLERLGHQACLYTANAGAIAEFARGEGVPVGGRAELPRDRDVVIANDAATCFGRAHRYRDPVRVFVAHSRDLPLQAVKQKRPDHTAGVDEKAAVQERPRSPLLSRDSADARIRAQEGKALRCGSSARHDDPYVAYEQS